MSLPSSADLETRLALLPIDAVEAELRRREQRVAGVAQDQSLEASKERCKTLGGFIREAWHLVEPMMPLIWNWHIDAICDHLEAVTRGDIIRLLINVPPGTMKSLIVSVFWPAWEWGPAGLPSMRYFTTSYKLEGLADRDSRKMRDLVRSEWFQERWGATCTLTRTGEIDFENNSMGWRKAMAFIALTGGRGDRVIIDDPHSVKTAESLLQREDTIRTFRESVPSRVMDPQTSAIVIVMQRLSEEDVSGVALKLGLGYVHLMLPMEFEPDRCCETKIGFKDPRTYDGELLFPERWTREVIERDKKALGSFAWAGQYQQRPQAREGGMFKRHWLQKIGAAPAGTRWVRYWDLAATEEKYGTDPAYTAGVKLGRMPDGRFVVGDVARLRAEAPGVRRLMKDTAKADGIYTEIGFSQDPGQAGKVQKQDYVLHLKGYIVHPAIESGDKASRAEPVATQAEAGNLVIVEGDWNEAFINELTLFPGSKFKDQVDALSGAFAMLLKEAMFSTPEDWFAVEGGVVPSHWPRVGAIDVTTSSFNAVWIAFEPATNVAYVYEALSVPRNDYAIHARAVLARGPWVPFLMDWNAHGRSKVDNEAIAEALTSLNVNLMVQEYSFEAAVQDMAGKFETSEIRVFQNLTPWWAEYRRVGRNEKGEIDEAHAGILRATGLALTQGRSAAMTENTARPDSQGLNHDEYSDRNPVTGY